MADMRRMLPAALTQLPRDHSSSPGSPCGEWAANSPEKMNKTDV